MDSVLVGAALLSAALHAAWNAAVKSSARPPLAMTAQLLASAALAVPVLCWVGSPAPASWPWMALSTLLSMGAVATLLRAYEHGGFSVVYPTARASSVLLVLPLAAAVAGEWPRPLGLLGVMLVSAAVWTQAPIAPASALRDTSAIFATMIAVTLLEEPFDRRVLHALALATSGTAMIRLG